MTYQVGSATYDDTPVTREPKQLMCMHCKTRAVIPDGHGGVVHEDDYRYQCEVGKPGTTFAEVRHDRS